MEHKTWLSFEDVDTEGVYVNGPHLSVPGDLVVRENLGRVYIPGDVSLGGSLTVERGTDLYIGGLLSVPGDVWIEDGALGADRIRVGGAISSDGGRVSATWGIRTAEY